MSQSVPLAVRRASQLERLRTLGSLIEQIAQSVEEESGPRQMTAALMLHALKAFTETMFQFFEAGFLGSQGYKLGYRNTAPNYVYALLNEQVSNDVDAILHAYMQRQFVAAQNARQNSTSAIALQAAELDKLAYSILSAAIQAGNVTTAATVFTYFQKSLRIRQMPYVRVAFIGVPHGAISNADETLAVAHEVGHYVYRSSIDGETRPGRSNNRLQTVREQAEWQPAWYSAWLDEIVADIFGCIIAGPHIALSAQELCLQTRTNWMGNDDGRHPPPALNPFIYIDTLLELGAVEGQPWQSVNLKETADKLEKRWEDLLGEYLREHTEIRFPGFAQTYSINEARDMIRQQVIKDFVKCHFAPLVTLLNPAQDKAWLFQQVWGDAKDWESWDEKREPSWPAKEGGAAPPELEWGPGKGSIKVGLSATTEGGKSASQELVPLGKTCTKFDQTMEALRQLKDPQNPETPWEESEWREVLTFGGWIEQGPPGGVPHD